MKGVDDDVSLTVSRDDQGFRTPDPEYSCSAPPFAGKQKSLLERGSIAILTVSTLGDVPQACCWGHPKSLFYGQMRRVLSVQPGDTFQHALKVVQGLAGTLSSIQLIGLSG